MANNFLQSFEKGQLLGLRAQEAQRQNKLRQALQQGDFQTAMAIDPQTTTGIMQEQRLQQQQQMKAQQQAQQQRQAKAKNLAGQALMFHRMIKGADTQEEARLLLDRMGPEVAKAFNIDPQEVANMSVDEFIEEGQLAEPKLKSFLFADLPASERAKLIGEEEPVTGSFVRVEMPDGTERPMRRDDPRVDEILDQGGDIVPEEDQPGVEVNVGAAESAGAKERAKGVASIQVEDFKSTIESGRQARAQARQLDQMKSLTRDISGTGPGKQAITTIKAFASGTLGIDPESFGITDDTAPAEAFDAVSKQLALRLRNPESGLGLTGNTSDRDVRFLEAAVPGLGKTQEGNKLLFDMWGRVLKRRQKEAQLARRFQREHGLDGVDEQGRTMQEFIDDFNEENPIFPEGDAVTEKAEEVTQTDLTNIEQTVSEAQQFLNRGQ